MKSAGGKAKTPAEEQYMLDSYGDLDLAADYMEVNIKHTAYVFYHV